MPNKLTVIVAVTATLGAAAMVGAVAQSPPGLDYEYFKTRVQPIFLKKRSGHTRCYVCHAESNNAFHLEKLAPGEKIWNEEQSRKNFETVSKLVNPGDPDTSRLLMQPLAPEAGGNVFHSGGRQFAFKDDPDYRIIVQWVKGAKPGVPLAR